MGMIGDARAGVGVSGYTLPASNILHKLTHQPLWKHASGLPPPYTNSTLNFI